MNESSCASWQAPLLQVLLELSSVEVRAVDRHVTVGALRFRGEARVESGNRRVAAVTKVGDALRLEHVPVGRAVGRVARRRNPRSAVRRARIRTARPCRCGTPRTACCLNPPRLHTRRRLVRAVAIGAAHHAFLKAVALVELELCEDRRRGSHCIPRCRLRPVRSQLHRQWTLHGPGQCREHRPRREWSDNWSSRAQPARGPWQRTADGRRRDMSRHVFDLHGGRIDHR